MEDREFQIIKTFCGMDEELRSGIDAKDLLTNPILSRLYYNSVASAITIMKLDKLFGISVSDFGYDDWDAAVIDAITSVNQAKIMLRLEEALRASPNNDECIELDSAWKSKIRSYISHIKSILEKADISLPLKERVLKSLNRFEQEVDRERTNTTKIADIWLELTEAAGKGVKNLEPAIQLLERLAKAIGRVKNETVRPRLPPPDNELLPPPEKNPEK